MKWSPEILSLIAWELHRIKKSSGWWRWTEKSPGCSSSVVYRTSTTSSAKTTGQVPVIEATVARCSTFSVSSISTLREMMARIGSEGSTAGIGSRRCGAGVGAVPGALGR